MSEKYGIFQTLRKFVYIRHETCKMKCNVQSRGCTCMGKNTPWNKLGPEGMGNSPLRMLGNYYSNNIMLHGYACGFCMNAQCMFAYHPVVYKLKVSTADRPSNDGHTSYFAEVPRFLAPYCLGSALSTTSVGSISLSCILCSAMPKTWKLFSAMKSLLKRFRAKIQSNEML